MGLLLVCGFGQNFNDCLYFATSTQKPHMCASDVRLRHQLELVCLIQANVFFTNQRGRSMLNNSYLIQPIFNPLNWLLSIPSCWSHHPLKEDIPYCQTTVPPATHNNPNHYNTDNSRVGVVSSRAQSEAIVKLKITIFITLLLQI